MILMTNNKNENRKSAAWQGRRVGEGRYGGGSEGVDRGKGKKWPDSSFICVGECGVVRTITYCLPSSSDRYIIQRFPVTAVAAAAAARNLPFTTLLYHFMYTHRPASLPPPPRATRIVHRSVPKFKTAS